MVIQFEIDFLKSFHIYRSLKLALICENVVVNVNVVLIILKKKKELTLTLTAIQICEYP